MWVLNGRILYYNGQLIHDYTNSYPGKDINLVISPSGIYCGVVFRTTSPSEKVIFIEIRSPDQLISTHTGHNFGFRVENNQDVYLVILGNIVTFYNTSNGTQYNSLDITSYVNFKIHI